MTRMPHRLSAALVLGAALWSCAAEPGQAEPNAAAGASGADGTVVSVSGGGGAGLTPMSSGGGGGTSLLAGGSSGSGGSVAVTGATSGAGGALSGGGASSGGSSSAAGAGGNAAAGSTALAGAGGVGAAGGHDNCNLPATVSFKNDVQKAFLATSCGGTGCHVVDASSTVANGGFNHGYDWITAGAHKSSCPDGPKRFEVVLAVIAGANPQSCAKSRQMPPPGAAQAPLTACQIAALQAWLAEPMVLQTHRADDSSPTTPYLMPPFN